MGRKRRARGQQEFRFRTWGGKRRGAGRKPAGSRPGVPHRSRPAFARRTPLHVTLRMAPHVWNLRSRRSFRVIEQALRGGSDRFGTQVVKFSAQGNHIHLLVEAESTEALCRAMRGLEVRLAKGLNRMMGRSGRVMGDRYHMHLLRTPTEMARALGYVRDNARRHAPGWGEQLPPGWVDPFSSESPRLSIVLPEPKTWLARSGWQRARAGAMPRPAGS